VEEGDEKERYTQMNPGEKSTKNSIPLSSQVGNDYATDVVTFSKLLHCQNAWLLAYSTFSCVHGQVDTILHVL
jgi:hypothetical protein